MKAYIHHFARGGTQDDPKLNVIFDSHVEKAWHWNSLTDAEIDRLDLNKKGITIRSADGKRHGISEFKTEETSAGKFVIWCDIPFIGQ